MTKAKTHYEVLELPKTATEAEIKKAFYQLLRKFPPERKPREYQRLREAFDVLSNSISRHEYDSMSGFDNEIESLRQEAEALLREEEPDFGRAATHLKRAILLGPEIGFLRHLLGQCLFKLDKLDDANRQLTRALRIDPLNSNYSLTLADVEEEMGRSNAAELIYRKVWERNPEDYQAPRRLAGLLFRHERIEEALSVLDIAINADGKIDFQDFFSIYDKCQILLFSGNHERLDSELEMITRVASRSEEKEFASFMLTSTGTELFTSGAHQLAKRFLDAARALNPGNEEIGVFAEAAQEASAVSDQISSFQKRSDVHDLVKALITLGVALYLDEINESEFKQHWDPLMEALSQSMKFDPDNSIIKSSLKIVCSSYTALWKLNTELYQKILVLPDADLVSGSCLRCGEPLIVPNDWSAYGCPGCGQAVRVRNKQISTT
ncbi:DnaJ domain-containing protein [bacterium]|nr:DnaJ domain-containing protein [bacterium]